MLTPYYEILSCTGKLLHGENQNTLPAPTQCFVHEKDNIVRKAFPSM